MQSQDSYSQQVYEILRQFLPQIQKQIREEMQNKLKAQFTKKYEQSIKQFEQQASKRINQEMNKITRQKQIQIKSEYQKMYQNKVKQLEIQNEQTLKRFKTQLQTKKQFDNSKQKQFNLLLQQKASWEKLQKQYQRTIKEIGKQNVPKTERQQIKNKSIEKEKRNSFISPLNASRQISNTKNINSKAKNTNFLKIQIPKPKQNQGVYSQIGSQLYKKDDNISDYSSLLSPPHIENQQLDKKKMQSKQKRSVFWNQQKKKQLLDMIRRRII